MGALILPHFLHWPWQHGVEWMWWPESDHGYAFFSSVGGTPLFAIGAFTATYRVWRKHTECHVSDCSNHGHRVHGTPYFACHEHHPMSMHKPSEAITAEHIQEAHNAFGHSIEPSYRPKGAA